MKHPVDIKYNVKYQNAKGKVKDHHISPPFDSLKQDGEKVGFVAYSHGRGIRSFRDDRVLEMSAVDSGD
tara:strand:- start:115 stop:321 length:207 start_codon:yes stop_codon:yes gene_type:complete